jgi:hypothetical protein
VSTPETPRIWMLRRRFGEPWNVTGPDNDRGPIEVIEKAPVDAERERLLDLLERFDTWCIVANTKEPESAAVLADVKALLREYGRLGKEES